MKTSFTNSALSRCASSLMLCGMLALGLVGCGSSTTPDLKITSIAQNRSWQQSFTQAWIAHTNNGDFDVVLVDEATEQAMQGAPITAPVRQVMHIRVLWAPTRDMKAVVSNAAVKWYVIGRSQPQGILEYSGIAFVSVEESEGGAKLRVRNAVLSPSTGHCQLTDPVGPSRLEGSFVARQDADTVARVLENVKTAAAACSSVTPMAQTDK